jgi:glyoxylase-like metal-dependent hydrolase (beta-lactamase superfamily II)
MPAPGEAFFVPELSSDFRLRVFRRHFNAIEEFEEMEVDAYILISDHYLVVFDTLLCPEDVNLMMQAVQDELAGRKVLVVNSHADWDHAWGNAFFSGERAAPIIAHEYGLLRMQSEEARADLSDYQRRYAIFRHVELVPPTLTFNSRLTIHDDNLTIELFAAPGHQPDHIAAWIPRMSLLLAFDAVEKPLPCIENALAVPAMFATLEGLLALQPQRVLCSHGKTTSPEQVKENLAYLREIERRCRASLQQGRPTQQELEHASKLINYSFDEVTAGSTEAVGRTFYAWAHDANVRYIMQWLMTQLN